MIRIAPGILLDEAAITETFQRASGPGGQNVNKVETAVQLRLSLDRAGLPPAMRARLVRLAGHRATLAGEIVITAQRHRTQDRNRTEARDSLMRLLLRAAVAPVRRIATKPTLASRQERLRNKTARSLVKRHRGRVADHE